MVLNKFICQAYAIYIPVLLNVLFYYTDYYCKKKNETAIMTQNWHVPIIVKAGDMTSSQNIFFLSEYILYAIPGI